MRILTVSAFYESHGGGIEIVAGATARALARRGHESRWAAAAFDPAPTSDGVHPAPLDAHDPIERWTGLPMPFLKRHARRLLKAEIARVDAVIIHDALYLSSILAALYARRNRKPWILIQHIGSIPYKSPILKGLMSIANALVTTPMLRRAPLAMFISDTVRATFDSVGWSTEPDLMFNGVDSSLFYLPEPADRAVLRAERQMSDDRRQLLFVGRFVEKKGLPTLRELAAANPSYDLLLVGSGPIDPASWQLPNVKLLGRKSRRELADLYRAVDALVLPSVGEGFPLVVQEAMACGLPAFCGLDSASADPDARGFLHGIDVEPEDPAGTARRLAQAIASMKPGPYPDMAAYAAARYDWDNNARWLERRIYQLRPANNRPQVRHAHPQLS